jgi:hypothetical protein
MEEPSRLLTRLALDFVKHLFTPKYESLTSGITAQFESFHVYNKTLSDAISVSHSMENLTKSISSVSKKRYNHWTEDEENKLINMIK